MERGQHQARQGIEKARLTQRSARQALIDAEKQAGINFSQVPENFQKFISNQQVKIGKKTIKQPLVDFGNKMEKLTEKGVDFLAQNVDVKTLQTMRKIAQEGLKKSGSRLNDITGSQLSKARDIIAQAIGKAEPRVGKALSEFRTAKEGSAQAVSRARDLTSQAKKREALIKTLERRAKTAGAGLLGLEFLRRLGG